MTANKLPMVLVVVIVVIVLSVLFVGGGDDDSMAAAPASAGAPAKPGESGTAKDPGQDTSVETLQTVAAGLATANEEIASLRQERSDSLDLMQGLKDQVSSLQGQLQSMRSNTHAPNKPSVLPTPSDVLPDIPLLTERPVKTDVPGTGGYPLNDAPVSLPTPPLAPSYSTLTPLIQPSAAPVQAANAGANPLAGGLDSAIASDIPRYTLHPGTTLFNAVSMTAMLGRVPVAGQVSDPVPVKFVIGDRNLAANGHEIPGLSGMIFTGNAIGDWTMSCVQVVLKSATLVFPDGRIRTLPKQSNGSGSDSGSLGNGIGYITDRSGNCVPGQRITDRDTQAGWNFIGGALEGWASAIATEQTTQTVSADGNASSTVTGDAGQYQLGNAIKKGVKDTRQSYQQLWADTFDVIYAPPATPVVIHIDVPLEIDYETEGRQVVYAQTDRARRNLD